MQQDSPFGITSGGIGTSGSCVGGNQVSIIPWATAKAEAEDMDLSSWLGLSADAATSGMSSMSEDEEKKYIETAITRSLPYERAEIRRLTSRSYGDQVVLVAIAIMIEQMEEEAAEANAPAAEPAPAPVVEPATAPAAESNSAPRARKTTKRRSAPKKTSKKSTKSKSKTRKTAKRKAK